MKILPLSCLFLSLVLVSCQRQSESSALLEDAVSLNSTSWDSRWDSLPQLQLPLGVRLGDFYDFPRYWEMQNPFLEDYDPSATNIHERKIKELGDLFEGMGLKSEILDYLEVDEDSIFMPEYSLNHLEHACYRLPGLMKGGKVFYVCYASNTGKLVVGNLVLVGRGGYPIEVENIYLERHHELWYEKKFFYLSPDYQLEINGLQCGEDRCEWRFTFEKEIPFSKRKQGYLLTFSDKLDINGIQYLRQSRYEGDRKFEEYTPLEKPSAKIRYGVGYSYRDSIYDINNDGLLDLIVVTPTTGPDWFQIHLSDDSGYLPKEPSQSLYDYRDLGNGRFLEVTSHRCPYMELKYSRWTGRGTSQEKVCYWGEGAFYCLPTSLAVDCLEFDSLEQDFIQKFETEMGVATQNILREYGVFHD